MKKEGIIIDYNGFVGKIKSIEGEEYLMLRKDIIGDVKEDDKVLFTPDLFKTIDYERQVARFIRKLEK